MHTVGILSVLETQRLQRELEKANQNITVLDAKLNHARRMLDKEKKKRLEAESNSTALVRKLKIFICVCVRTSAKVYVYGLESCRCVPMLK